MIGIIGVVQFMLLLMCSSVLLIQCDLFEVRYSVMLVMFFGLLRCGMLWMFRKVVCIVVLVQFFIVGVWIIFGRMVLQCILCLLKVVVMFCIYQFKVVFEVLQLNCVILLVIELVDEVKMIEFCFCFSMCGRVCLQVSMLLSMLICMLWWNSFLLNVRKFMLCMVVGFLLMVLLNRMLICLNVCSVLVIMCCKLFFMLMLICSVIVLLLVLVIF